MTVIADARQHDVVTADGRRLRVYDAGSPDGDLVLVHHGTPCSGILASWWAQDALSRGIRLVGYDRPGYGDSDRHPGRSVADAAADSAAIADALGVGRFRTWGVSGGGPHALACAALLPERVIAAATLASVAPYTTFGEDWYAGMGADNVDEFGAAVEGEKVLRPYVAEASAQLVAAGQDGLVGSFSTLLPPMDVVAVEGEMGGFLYAWLADGQRNGCDGWVDDDLAFVADWGFDPADITVPVLIVQGRHDLMVPFRHGEWLATRIPDAAAWLSGDDGHLTLIVDLAPTHAWLLDQS